MFPEAKCMCVSWNVPGGRGLVGWVVPGVVVGAEFEGALFFGHIYWHGVSRQGLLRFKCVFVIVVEESFVGAKGAFLVLHMHSSASWNLPSEPLASKLGGWNNPVP